MGKRFKTELIITLRSTFFSLIIEETTDITVEKQLAVMVEYYDIVKSETVLELLDLVVCENGTALSLTNNVLSLFTKFRIPF